MVCKSIFWNNYLQLLISMEVFLNNWCYFQVKDFSFLTLISFNFWCYLYTFVDLRSCFAQKYRKLIQVKICILLNMQGLQISKETFFSVWIFLKCYLPKYKQYLNEIMNQGPEWHWESPHEAYLEKIIKEKWLLFPQRAFAFWVFSLVNMISREAERKTI
jgi:hypothetical protein